MDSPGELASAELHPGEEISAVQDADNDPFLYGGALDEDDDDLYHDVNVGDGDGFLPLPQPTTSTPSSAAAPPPHPPPPPQPPVISPEKVPQPLPPPPPPQPPLPTPANAPTQAATFAPTAAVTTLFIGELHWWTTDADIEEALSAYGHIREVRFFDNKASGKSKGYCQADFLLAAAAASAQAGLHGRPFHGRPCVAALAPPHEVRRLGEAQLRSHLASAPPPQQGLTPKPRLIAATQPPKYGRGNGGRGGNVGNLVNRSNVATIGRSRMVPGGGGGRGIVGNGGIVPLPLGAHLLPHGGMLGQPFSRIGGIGGAGYGGFPMVPSSGLYNAMMPGAFQPVVTPHVNPAFFGRGMAPGGGGMWPDQGMGGCVWGGEEQGNYGDGEMPEQQQQQQYYGDGGYGQEHGTERDWLDRRHEREKDMSNGQNRPERRHREERDQERHWERERDGERERVRYQDKRDRHGGDHKRYREHVEHDDCERRGLARSQSQSRDDDHPRRRC